MNIKNNFKKIKLYFSNFKNTRLKNMFNNIRSHILIYLVLFSIFILFTFFLSQSVLTNYLYRRYQIRDVENIADRLLEVEKEDINNTIIDIVKNNSVCVEYVDNSGESILYNDYYPGCLFGKFGSNMDIRKYKTQLRYDEKEQSGIEFVNPDFESRSLLYGVEVDDGYVYIFTMLSSVDKNNEVIGDQIIYLAIVVFVLAIVVSFFLSKKFSKPIMDINEKTKLIANGNYNVVFDKSDIYELDELADTLNYLECEISKTDEYRRDLMANVSHDLKTPLTMIKAYAEMVRDITYKNKNKREENLNVIISETDRLNVLVNDILELSKMQANVSELNFEKFNLKDEINDIIRRYDVICEQEGYIINVTCEDSVIVEADKSKINQVIYNLLNNALNYTGNDKEVSLIVTEEKKDYLIEIKDSGKGIDKKDLLHIWDKYYKKEKNHKRNVVGTGLGLSIVKSILESHKFEFGVNSVLNKGTVFWFKIKKSNVK